MENFISYTAGGERFQFATPLTFSNLSDTQVAIKVYLEISRDRDSKLIEGRIRLDLTSEEKRQMTDEAILEWRRISNILFVDEICNKQLCMGHMSDFQGNFHVMELER